MLKIPAPLGQANDARNACLRTGVRRAIIEVIAHPISLYVPLNTPPCSPSRKGVILFSMVKFLHTADWQLGMARHYLETGPETLISPRPSFY